MTNNSIQTAYVAAIKADDAFEVALFRNGFRSRWDWSATEDHTSPIKTAYLTKIAADEELHKAFETARCSPRV